MRQQAASLNQSHQIGTNGTNSNNGNAAKVKKSVSQVMEILGEEESNTGVANIPNQVHYTHSKRKININIMLFGERGVGKTGIINQVLGQPVFTDQIEETQTQAAPNSKEVTIRIRRQEIEESGSHALLSVIDLPKFGQNHGKHEAGAAALAYLKDQFEGNLREESKLRRQQDGLDSRVHSVLYFHNPTNHKLSNLDVDLIKNMSKLANVIIVVAKGDTLLRHEFSRIKNNMREQLRGITVFQGSEDQSDNKSSFEPFICVSGCDLLAPSPARNYLWGSLKITPSALNAASKSQGKFLVNNSTGNMLQPSSNNNGSVNLSLNINGLTNLLFKDYLPDLILGTAEKYENWKSEMIRGMNVKEEEWQKPAEVLQKIVEKLNSSAQIQGRA